jgi:hypothetical protein
VVELHDPVVGAATVEAPSSLPFKPFLLLGSLFCPHALAVSQVPEKRYVICLLEVFTRPLLTLLLLFVWAALSHGGNSLIGFRENVDMAFIFRLHSDTQIDAVAENFLGMVPKKTARELLETCVWKDEKTGQRQFLVVDNSGNSDVDHMLYLGQAQEPPPFTFGCKEWWSGAENDETAGKPQKN